VHDANNLLLEREYSTISRLDRALGLAFVQPSKKFAEENDKQENCGHFPVLQAVYPDLENRFPEEEGFDKAFEQPLMQPDVPMTRIGSDFWASADPTSSLFSWKFPDPPHTGVYLSKTVNNGTEPVTFVSHDAEDGAWQLLGDSMSDPGGVISCFHHPIDRDPSIAELADLPLGWYAERDKVGEPWIGRKRLSEDASG